MKTNAVRVVLKLYEQALFTDEVDDEARKALRLAWLAGARAALGLAEAHGDEFDVPVEWVKRFAAEADGMMRKEATK